MQREYYDWTDPESDGEWLLESEDPSFGDVYEVVRPALAGSWRNAPAEQIEALLQEATRNMTGAEQEDFMRSLANFGRQVAPMAGQVISVGAPILGTALGGPVGAALGGVAGQFAGQALGSRPMAAAPGAVPLAPGAAAGQPPTGTAPASPAAGSPATTQLLGLLQNPQLLQSVLGQLLGPAGQSVQPVGPTGAPAPFGAFMNALSVLANQAASEAAPDSTSGYMYGARGELLGDPASPEERAAVLLSHLRASPRYA